jgi:hypothetical protein
MEMRRHSRIPVEAPQAKCAMVANWWRFALSRMTLSQWREGVLFHRAARA